MKAYTTPTNVTNLLTAAAYVRNETIINGNQAAQLDAMTGLIKDLTTKIEAVPAKIADLAAQGKEKAVAMWERMAARYRAQFADAVATLRDWLVDFKANRPNVQINLDEPETPETSNPDNTPTTMNANETQAPKFSELAHAKIKASPRTLKFGRNAGFYNPVDAFRFRASVLPDMHYNDDAEDQIAEIERYNRNAARCAKIAAKYGITLN